MSLKDAWRLQGCGQAESWDSRLLPVLLHDTLLLLLCRPYTAHLSASQRQWLNTQLESQCKMLEDGDVSEVEVPQLRQTLTALQVSTFQPLQADSQL